MSDRPDEYDEPEDRSDSGDRGRPGEPGEVDRDDEFAARLRDSVEPLTPPPGTYDKIRRRARTRKLARAVSVGAAAVVVIAGGAFAPHLIRTALPRPVDPATSHATPIPTAQPSVVRTHRPPPRPSPTGDRTTGHVSPAPTRTTTTAPDRCHTADLSAQLTAGDAGAGQRHAGLILTNTSSRTCTLYGYVGVALIGADTTNLIRDGGTEASITVAPGDSAATSLQWTAIPGTGEANGCPRPTAAEITPPDETTQLSVDWPGGQVCQHGELHTVPLVEGSSPPVS